MFRTNTLNHSQSKAPGLGYFMVLMIASLLAVLVSATNTLGAQNIEKLNRLVQASNSSEPAAKMFREGREFIDGKKWARAAERFGDFINDYPDDKNVDAALYWRAYALARQKKAKEALESAQLLVANYSNSSWRDDAEALILEISKDPALLDERLKDEKEKDEELKIIALQGLFQSDPSRATLFAAEWLKPGSNRSQEAKEAAISLLGQYGGAQGASMLADIVRNQPDEDLRVAAIHWVAVRGTLDDLIKLYDAERSEDVKQALLHRIAEKGGEAAMAKLMQVAKSDSNMDLRISAIHRMTERAGPQAVPLLIQLFDSERDQEVKESVLHRLAERSQNSAAMEKLLSVAKSDANLELRESAIHRIAERSGTQATTFLIQIYDSERNEEVKESVLHRLAERWQDQAAQAKLMDVAKNDSNLELRESAIHRIAERSSVGSVIQLFDAEKNNDIKESLLHRIAEKIHSQRTSAQDRDAAMAKLMDVAKNDPDSDVRQSAIHRIAEMREPGTLNLVIQLYDAEKDSDVKESILHRIAERQEPEALQRLIAIAQNDANEEMRASAMHRIAERRGGQGVDALIQFYDNEKSEDVKESILHKLGEAARNPTAGDSPQKRALRKLMQVAKSDPSVEMRTRAVHLIGESKDPEAKKFLEELIK